MWEDPIVAEVHRARRELAAKHNFDVALFFADLRRREAALDERLVRQQKREAPAVAPDSDGANGSSRPDPSPR